MNKRKIINDPVYGFITIANDLVFDLIQHPYFQRLRNIQQLGLSSMVYPGALHTRFQHSLGALHLMRQALDNLKYKGVEIIEGHMMPDHVHLLLSIPPKTSVSSFMGYLKGKSALLIFQRWGNMKFAYILTFIK